jgi:endonuclease/exonuclease/phosphatase family metal-dependent hydrolase
MFGMEAIQRTGHLLTKVEACIFMFLYLRSLDYLTSYCNLKMLKWNSEKEIKLGFLNVFLLPAIASNSDPMPRIRALSEKIQTELQDLDVFCVSEMWHGEASALLRQLMHKQGYKHFVITRVDKCHITWWNVCGVKIPYLGLFQTHAGLAVFSKHPILSTKTLSFSESATSDILAQKGCLKATIRHPHGNCTLFVTHMQSGGERLEEVRFAQAKEIAEFIKGNGKAVFLGDTNADADERKKMLDTIGATPVTLKGPLKFTYNTQENELAANEGPKGAMQNIDVIATLNTSHWSYGGAYGEIVASKFGIQVSDHELLRATVTIST